MIPKAAKPCAWSCLSRDLILAKVESLVKHDEGAP